MENQAAQETVVEQEVKVTAPVNPFAEESWAENPVNTVEPNNKQQITEEVKTEVKPEAKQEIPPTEVKTEEVKPEVKVEKVIEPLTFANDESKRVYELLKEGKTSEVAKILSERSKIQELVSGEVTVDTAEEIIKMGMRAKFKDLTPSEINYKYNKQFSLPKEPVQDIINESDEEFAIKHGEWKSQVEALNMEKIIEAKTLRPQLEQLNQELVLPELEAKAATNQPTPEEAETVKRYTAKYLQDVDTVINGLEGFVATVKDEAVEIPLAYSLTPEQKTEIKSMMNLLAENNFSASAIFAERWVNDDKTLNVSRMAKDLQNMLYGDEASQKFANDAANKRLEEYIKSKANVSVTGNQQTFNPQKVDETKQMADFFFSQ